MKKQEMSTGTEPSMINAGKDSTSRVLLVVAVILYSASLILLANLALAGEKGKIGALIKVNNQLDGDAFEALNAKVKSFAGNVLAIDIPETSLASIGTVKGICASNLDHSRSNELGFDASATKAKYAGAGVVIGILDNNGVLSASAHSNLQKMEVGSNVGFISYVSDDPNSTVIMRNIKGGESNLIQALLYMEEYAKTVEKPLVIELKVGAEEMSNALFVQVCQKFAETGVQFLGCDISRGISSEAPIQLAFSMFNSETGQITDQSDFWAIQEVKEQKIMLMGSDKQTCTVHFQTESGYDKIYLSSTSSDLVMVTTISADGSVNYYHVENKETALIPRKLINGTPILEDGLAGIYPYHSKGILYNGAVASKQFVTVKHTLEHVQLNSNNGMAMKIGSPSYRTLAMSLENVSSNLCIEIKDETGAMVYRNQPDEDIQSIRTRIDLSGGMEGLYFLDLRSPEFHQTFALMMN